MTRGGGKPVPISPAELRRAAKALRSHQRIDEVLYDDLMRLSRAVERIIHRNAVATLRELLGQPSRPPPRPKDYDEAVDMIVAELARRHGQEWAIGFRQRFAAFIDEHRPRKASADG